MERTNALRMGRAGSAGFTLLEMLIVVVILGLIAALIVNNVGNKAQQAKTNLAQAGVAQAATWVEQFQLDVGRYPTVAEGMKALVEKPQNADGWRGPYTGKNSVPKDPWKNEYVYEWDAEKGWFIVKSLGADGKPGGEGDAADVDNRS